MRKSRKMTRLLAMALTLAMVLSGCQLPATSEDASVPSSVVVESESDSASVEVESSEEVTKEDILAEDDILSYDDEFRKEFDLATRDEAVADPDPADEPLVDLDAEEKETTVVLASGRDWVKYVLDVADYRKYHKDLEAAFGDDWDAYVDHWLTTGVYEGRTQGVLFDPFAYANAYEDVKAECGDDVNKIIEHYIAFGLKENRPIGTTEGYEDFADKISREQMVGDAIDRTPSTRLEALVAQAENVMLYGRNIEGVKYPQLFTDGFNKITKEPAVWNRLTTDSQMINSNLYAQTNMLKMLEGLSSMTGDDKYKEAAYQQIQMRYDDPLLHDSNGLFYAGGHTIFDIIQGKPFYLYHETKDYQLPLELYYKVDPEGFERYVTAFWDAHVYDWSCLIMNRHGYYDITPTANWASEYTNPDPYIESWTAPFTCTGNDLAELAYYCTYMTGDPKYQAWGERLLEKYIGVTDPITGLTGAQYGIMVEEEDGVRDRWLYNFAGADFVDARGNDYKTLTEWDSRIVGETQKTDRNTIKAVQGYGPQVYITLYEQSGDEKVYDYVKGNMLGFVRYMYDKSIHRTVSPMSTNGTDFNPGEGNGPILIAPRGGYYASAGSKFAENEAVFELILKSLIDTVDMIKDRDPAEAAEIWEAVRAWGNHVELGDLGTFMGENVNVNLNTNSHNVYNTLAVISLYKHTGHEDYYNLAVKLGENILQAYFDEELGLFVTKSSSAYAKWDTDPMYAIFCIEAMTRGMLDEISLDSGHGGVDIAHDGRGQISDSEVFWDASKVTVRKVDLGAEQYSLIMGEVADYDIKDISAHKDERAIRQMVSLGLLTVDDNGNFEPEATVTHAQLAEMVVDLFDLENKAALDAILGEVPFDTNRIATREEMAYILVKALQNALPEKEFYIANALYRITDADTISAWARDYADIATNYRLMVDITEDTFQPKADVTKAMVADAFQNICRYIDLKGMHQLSAAITPYNADCLKVTWETSESTVVEVDEKGRLYPLKAGSATITAYVEKKFAEIEVIVSGTEEWMIKDITFNGEDFEDFNANTRAYEVNLLLGTTQVPTVEAVSYSGAPVIVNYPDALPGRIEFWVEGTGVKYTIDVDNSLIEYAVDENFNHKIGTALEKVATEKYNWFINGTSVSYNPSWKVIPKNWVRPDYEGYGCMIFPYRHEFQAGAIARMCLGSDYEYLFGPDADDKLLVIELELAVKNLSGKLNGFNIYFSEPRTTGSKSFARFHISNENEIKRRTDSTRFNTGTVRPLQDEEFYKLTLVVDKQTKLTSYYLNGELVENNISPFHANVTGFGTIYFEVTKEAEDCNAEMFFDNIKVYELQKSVVEEQFEQVPSPTFTPKPTAVPNPAWVEYPLNENYDGFEIGTLAAATTVDKGYVWGINGQVYPNLTKVVAKTDVDSTASATDYCLEIPYNAEGGEGNYRLNIDENLIFKLGADAVDDKSVVFEMDFAIGGEGKKANGWRVFLSQRAGSGGYLSSPRFHITEDLFGRMKDSSSINTAKAYPMYKNQFSHLKVVINKQTKKFTYYLNGVPVEVGVAAMHANVPNIGTIYIGSPLEVVDLESKLYIDNLKLYVEETKPEPTEVPAPTPKPTATPMPYPVNEDYNSYAEGSTLASTSKQEYAWAITPAAQAEAATIISKASVFAGAAAEDYCVKIPYDAATDVNYRLNLSAENAFPLDTAVIGNKEIVIEMEVAFAGDGAKVNGYNVFFSQKHPAGTRSSARFNISDVVLKRYISSAVASATDVAPGKDAFANYKVVIDPATKTYKYYWNGALKGTGCSPIHTNSPNFGTLQITALREESQMDVSLYIDNLKIYLADPVVGETPAPTAVPAPTATVAPGATAAPTAEPTEAPVPEATVGPVKVDEGFDDKTLGANAESTTGDGYTWSNTAAVAGMAKVIAKNTVDGTAAAGDYCIEIPNATAGSYTIKLDESRQVAYDDGGYLVVEMDVATNGAMGADFRIEANNAATQSIERIKLSGNKMVLHGPGTSATMNANTFYHSKLVYDITGKTYTWLVDDEVKISGRNQLHGTHNLFGSIKFTIGGSGGTDKAFIDNVKIYTSESNPLEAPATPAPTAEPTPAPTAEPTAAPTEAPAEPTAAPGLQPQYFYSVNEGYDGFETGTTITNTATAGYSWGITSAYGNDVKVVAKTDVVSGANANDKCLVFPYVHGYNRNATFRLNLNAGAEIVVGENATDNNTVVVEVDVAMAGAGAKEQGFNVYVSKNYAATGQTHSVARIDFKGNQFGPIDDATGAWEYYADGLRNMDKNVFHTLKFVIDKKDKTYDYFVDGVLVKENVVSTHDTVDSVGTLYFGMPMENADTDISFYVDNIKIYEIVYEE